MIFVIVALLVATLPSAGFASGGVKIKQSFRGNSASGWSILGDSYLTSGTDDPADRGWLRLTKNEKNQAGSAIYNTAFDSTKGFNITFDYATWGGDGADGFTVYLIDGSTTTPTVGATGGALGYAYDAATDTAGVTNGYIGIGFDEYGNFNNSNEFNGGSPGRSPGVTVRGPGSLKDAAGFPWIAHQFATIQNYDRANFSTVSITMTPPPVNVGDPNQKLTVYVDNVLLFDGLEIDNTLYPMPSTFKIGFSSSTGDATNYHEIRDLGVSGINPTVLTWDYTPGADISTGTFEATVSCTDIKAPHGPINVTGDVSFYDGLELLGTVTLTGAPTGTASLPVTGMLLGDHPITIRYSGDVDCAIKSSQDIVTIAEPPAAISAESNLPKTGFQPGVITKLPIKPNEKAYTNYGDLTLEIPSLKAFMPIVGVPKSDNSWDVTYLGKNAGYLNGTAFPTWVGNSVITAHVWDAQNQPGPFANIKQLRYGDQIKIRAFGGVYTYEVRESKLLWPSQSEIALMHKEDHSWITLLTCEDYSVLWNTYTFRRMVRAVVVDIQAE